MFLINQHLFAVPDVGEDILFDNLMNKATVLGYDIPSTINQNSLNTLIKDMRRIKMIQRLDLLQVHASDLGSATPFRLMNICNAEMIGTTNGNITWNNKGSKGNSLGTLATRGWINTGYNPYSGGYAYQLNNASIGSVIFENPDTSINRKVIIGATSASIANFGTAILAGDSTGNRINQASLSTYSQPTDLSGLGLKVLNRISSNNLTLISTHNIYEREVVSTSIINASLDVHVRSSLNNNDNFGDLGVSCVFAGAAIPFEMSQNFRQVYNKYLRSIGLQQVA